jgi:hypothetical protein
MWTPSTPRRLATRGQRLCATFIDSSLQIGIAIGAFRATAGLAPELDRLGGWTNVAGAILTNATILLVGN